MDIEMQQWFVQRAIEQIKADVDAGSIADGARTITADGHLLDPPIYPAYQSNSFEAYANYQGFWVQWFQKESAASPWAHPRQLVRHSELR